MVKVDITQMWIHGTVVEEIIDAAPKYSGSENGDKLVVAADRWKKFKAEWDTLEKANDYSLQLHSRFIAVTTLVLEVFNTVEPLKEEDGTFKAYNVPFKDLSLNSKEYSGYKMLFYEPPDMAALHWYHNDLGPLVYKNEAVKQPMICKSIQAIEVDGSIKAKDYLKEEGLDKANFKISLVGTGEIKPDRKYYLEPENTYLLIDSTGFTQALTYLYHETFGWYTRYYGQIVRGEHTSRFNLGIGELIAPGERIKVDEPISVKDYLASFRLSSKRYGISHVTMGIDLDTILVPNRSYMLVDELQVKEMNRRLKEMLR